MARKKISGKPAVDPTLPDVSVEINGKVYRLAYTFAALALAQAKLKTVNGTINVFRAVMFTDVDPIDLCVLFYAGLQANHPDLTYDEACELITLQNYGDVFKACYKAYTESMAPPDSKEDAANPPEPEQK